MPKKKEEKDFIKKVSLKAPKTCEYYVNIDTDKARYKFIKRTEQMIRSSLEYKDMLQYLKDSIGLDSCFFFKNVTKVKGKKLSVELHHEPLTLFDLVNTILTKCEEEGLPINDLYIADEVMRLHYENQVGLVPLSKTVHELVHNGKIFVPLNAVYGEYSRFLTDYEDYIDESVFDKIEKKVDQTKAMTPEDFDALHKEITEYDVEGFEDVEKLELKKEAQIESINSGKNEDEVIESVVA